MAYEELRGALEHLAAVDGPLPAPGNLNIQAIIAQQLLMATATPVLLGNLLADLDAAVARRDRLHVEMKALRAALEPFVRTNSGADTTTLVVDSLDITRARVALLLSGTC